MLTRTASPELAAAEADAMLRDDAGPPHLVHVFPSFDVGGAQVRFVALVKALGPRYVHTVVSLRGDHTAASLLPPGAPVALLKPPRAGGSALQRLRQYREQLRRLEPDLLLTYNWGSIEYAMARSPGLPHLHMEDGFGPEEETRQLTRRVWTRRLVLARSQVVVPSTTLQRIATRHWRLPASRVRHIANGVAPKSASASELSEVMRRLPANRPRIAWAGALRAEKNPLRLIRAFAPLRDKASLVVIGDGPEREPILAEAERLGLGDSLCLLGRRDDARELIMQCDLVALSSNTEQMPLVVLEAMDAGLPVASVDVGDVRRMVAPENDAFITPVDDRALGLAMAQLVACPEIRRTVGEANQRRARAVYTLPAMVEAYDGLIKEALASARRRTPAHG